MNVTIKPPEERIVTIEITEKEAEMLKDFTGIISFSALQKALKESALGQDEQMENQMYDFYTRLYEELCYVLDCEYQEELNEGIQRKQRVHNYFK